MGTPEKHIPQLSVTRNLNVRFADKEKKYSPASILRKSTSGVIGPSATLTGRWRPDIDLRRMLTGSMLLLKMHMAHIYLFVWHWRVYV